MRRRSGRGELHSHLDSATILAEAVGDGHPASLRDLGARSYLIVPLSARGHTLGAISFVLSRSDRLYGPEDLQLAEGLGARAALAVDNARLYQEAWEEFLSVASHELKNPLAALRMRVQGLIRARRSRGSDPAFLGEFDASLECLDRQSRLILVLLSELLDVSRLSARKLQLELEAVDLAAVVGDVAEALAPELERSGSKLEVDTPELVVGRWDALRLEQVVTNLLSNAIKYGAGRPIRVSTSGGGGRAWLRVRDEGIGIARENLQRIFAPFERAVSSRQIEGVGLGLFITRQLVEAHGGTIRVQSELNRGTTFEVELPLDAQPSITPTEIGPAPTRQ